MKVAVEEAHHQGRKVAAHAHGTEAIKNAMLAGVDSIEHGSFIDDEGIQMMKAHGTYLVGRRLQRRLHPQHGRPLHIPKDVVEKERASGRRSARVSRAP